MKKFDNIQEKLEFQKKRAERIRTYLPAIAFFLFGFLLLFIAHSYNVDHDIEHTIYRDTVKPLLENAGVIFIVLSIGTLLFEFFIFTEYTRSRIAELMTEYRFLDVLKKEYKDELFKKLFISRLKHNSSADLYDLSERIVQLFTDYYYNEFNVAIFCSLIVKKGKKYIEKNIKKYEVLIPVDTQSELFERLLNINVFNRQCIDGLEPLSIKYVKIDHTKVDYDIVTKALSFQDEQDKSEYILNLKERHTFSSECILEIEYTTIVPISDNMYNVRADRACKDFCVHFSYDNTCFVTASQGFTFMAFGENRFRILRRNNDCDKMIRVNNWILPGEGAIFVINEKAPDLNSPVKNRHTIKGEISEDIGTK